MAMLVCGACAPRTTAWSLVSIPEISQLVIIQTFERRLVNALAHEILALGEGWVAVAYEACGAAGARIVVLQRGGVGAVVSDAYAAPREHGHDVPELQHQRLAPATVCAVPGGPQRRHLPGFEL